MVHRAYLFFVCIFYNISYYLWMIMWMKKTSNFQTAIVHPRCWLVFAWIHANFSLTLLIKVLLIKKRSVLQNSCSVSSCNCIWNSFKMVTSQIEILLWNLRKCYNDWVCDVTLNGILLFETFWWWRNQDTI